MTYREAFHGSNVNTITKFHELSHFGTIQAATNRIIDIYKGKGVLYYCKFPFDKNLYISDDGNDTSVFTILRDLKVHHKIILSHINYDILSNYTVPPYPNKLEKNYKNILLAYLKSKNYDTLYYKNQVEDFNTLSYIPLKNVQILEKRKFYARSEERYYREKQTIESFLM